MGSSNYGIDVSTINKISNEIKNVYKKKYQICLIIGGGNIFRGIKGASEGIDRSTSDYMGMLATMINSMALQAALESIGLDTRLLSAIEMREVAEPYIRRRAVRHLEKGRVIIFAAGTGNPYFTTDTAAALRANEIDADIILKATKVDGVYDKDPLKHKDAVKFEHLKYIDSLNKDLKVMDSAALSLCMDNDIGIIVFNVFESGNIRKAIFGEKIGTLVTK